MPHVRTPLDRHRLAGYFREAFKPRSGWMVGIEVEKMGVDAADGRPLPFRSAGPSVEGVLRGLLDRRGGDPVFEGEALIGGEGPWGSLTLEPGGQVEWSSRPAASLDDLAGELHTHLDAMRDTGRTLGVRWIDKGVHPDLRLDEMPWMPKARYGIMRDFLGARGRLAHRMMTQTASVQCAFDYEDDADWGRKLRAGALFAPAAVALFANSSRVDGADSGWASYRQAIWAETDPARCELPAAVFEPGFDLERWIDWACSVPTIFLRRVNGLLPSGGVPFAELIDRCGCDGVTIGDWELHLSTLFPTVRSYTYVEVRSADLQPDDTILAVPAFWTGLLYHPDALEAALRFAASWDRHDAWRSAMSSAAKSGVDGIAAGVPLKDVLRRLAGLAAWGLGHGASCAGSGGAARDALANAAERAGVPLEESAP